VNLGSSEEGPAGSQARAAAKALLPELDCRQPPVRGGHHQVLRVLTALLAVGLVAGVFGGFWWYGKRTQDVGGQQDTAVPAMSFADRAAYRAARAGGGGAAPVVLTYHDIGVNEQDSLLVVSPASFAAQMAMLHESGYRTLTATQFTGYLRGTYTPPRRSVVITFDDGTRGLWTYADPVLARYNFHAVAFLITGRLGTHHPYYLSWPEAERMHENRRWDLQSHTHDLHTRVLIGPGGEMGSNLSNRELVEGRLESTEHFRARVQADLRQSVADLRAHGLPAPSLFAWPFSEAVGHLAHPSSVQIPKTMVANLFDASFTGGGRHPLPVGRRMIAQGEALERLEVTRLDSAREVFDQMSTMRDLPTGTPDPVGTDTNWLEPSRAPAPVDLDPVSGSVIPRARSLTHISAAWAPARTGDWVGYTVSAVVDNLSASRSTFAGLRVRVGSRNELSARVSAAQVSVQSNTKVLFVRGIVPGGRAEHRLAMTVQEGVTLVSVDDSEVARIPATTGPLAHGGFGIVSERESTTVPFPAFHALRVTPGSGS
jgi:biofilm PGA synthesis lipoprotein PgaB